MLPLAGQLELLSEDEDSILRDADEMDF